MKWLKRFWLRKRTERALSRPFNRHVPDRERIAELLYLLRVEQFNDYSPAKGMTVKMELLYPTVQELILSLQEVSGELHTDEYAKTYQTPYTRRSVVLEEFMVTKDRYIYDIRRAVDAFKHYATDICTILDGQKDFGNEIHYEHNTRVLTNLLGDVDELARGLLAVAYSKEV